MNKIELSKKQKEVVSILQRGGCLITSNEMKGAEVWDIVTNKSFRISNRVFWNLVDKGMIFQNMNKHQNYTITKYGKTIEL